jgi:hypothetical protein
MKVNAKLSINIGEEKTILTIKDCKAGIQFLELVVDNNMLLRALGRFGLVECDCELRGLENVGKKLVIDSMVFIVPEHDKTLAGAIADERCPAGWIPDKSFSSQDSFLYKDGRIFAKTTIRKWVE